MSIKEYAREMIASDPVFADIANQNETLWVNDKYLPFSMVDAVCQLVVSDEDIADAERRLKKFAPYISKCFPETREDGGLIESPLAEISSMKEALEKTYDARIPGRFLLSSPQGSSPPFSRIHPEGCFRLLPRFRPDRNAAGNLSGNAGMVEAQGFPGRRAGSQKQEKQGEADQHFFHARLLPFFSRWTPCLRKSLFKLQYIGFPGIKTRPAAWPGAGRFICRRMSLRRRKRTSYSRCRNL